MRRRIGGGRYALGSLDRRGGSLNPLSYARGLAKAAIKAGARIYTGTRARSLRSEGDVWRLSTRFGTVTARQALIGTNGYTDALWPGLEATVVPVLSSIAATEPLPADLRATILPERPSVYELSASHAYFRLDAAGRFLMGGRGVMRPSSDFADYRHLRQHAIDVFPELARVRWTHCWNGRVAVTWDELPHVHKPEPGLTIALGYNGRGVAMATAVGAALARHVMGEPLDLPVSDVRPIPAHFAWPLAVSARLHWETFKEALGI